MKKLLFLTILTCRHLCMAASEIGVEFKNFSGKVDETQLKLLKQSKTIENMLKDFPDATTIHIPVEGIASEAEFGTFLSLLSFLKKGNSSALQQCLSEQSLDALMRLWTLFDFLELPELLGYIQGALLANDEALKAFGANPKAFLEKLPMSLQKGQLPSNVVSAVFKEESPEITAFLKGKLGAQLQTITGQPLSSYVYDLVFNPQRTLLVVERSKTVAAETPQEPPQIENDSVDIYRFLEQKKAVLATRIEDSAYPVFNPQGALLAVCFDEYVDIYDSSNPEEGIVKITRLSLPKEFGKDSIDRASFSKEGTILAIFTEEDRVLLYDYSSTEKIVLVEQFKGDSVFEVAFSPQAQLLFVVGDKQIQVYDYSKFKHGPVKLVGKVDGFKSDVVKFLLSPREKVFLTGTLGGEVSLYDYSDVRQKNIVLIKTLTEEGGFMVSDFAFADDDLIFALASGQKIELYDYAAFGAKKISLMNTINIDDLVYKLIFAPKKRLLFARLGTTVDVYDYSDSKHESIERVKQIEGFKGDPFALACSPKGDIFVVGLANRSQEDLAILYATGAAISFPDALGVKALPLVSKDKTESLLTLVEDQELKEFLRKTYVVEKKVEVVEKEPVSMQKGEPKVAERPKDIPKKPEDTTKKPEDTTKKPEDTTKKQSGRLEQEQEIKKEVAQKGRIDLLKSKFSRWGQYFKVPHLSVPQPRSFLYGLLARIRGRKVQ